jgi:hypothetical protein
MKALQDLPAGVSDSLDLIGRLDACLLRGFARLGDEHRASLDALADVFAASPLEPALAEAVSAVGRTEFLPRAFLSLASARVALLGAVHDALVVQARAAFGRSTVSRTEPPPRPTGASSAALASVQQWLTELAIAGFRQLEETAVAPFSATLEALHADDGLTGLAVLLAGFHAELMRSIPASQAAEIHAFRWGDLWSAAMIRTQQLPGPVGFRSVSGAFVPFGLDVQSHENFVLASLYGVLEHEQSATARIPLGAYKVGVIAGAEIWDLLGDCAEPILAAMAEHRVLQLSHAELREDGDLVLRSPPGLGAASDPFESVARATSMPDPPAIARHPVHIAEIVRLGGRHGLPPAEERSWAGSPLLSSIADDAEQIALLRFDRGGWRYQPLAVRRRGGFVMAGEELSAARRKLKHRTVDILKERAGRLLRKS